jgi:hypothetical protein
MVKNCPSCGAELKEEYKFCLSCGVPLQQDAGTQQQPPAQPSTTQQQSYTQPSQIAPSQPRKINMKLIGAIITIIVVVIVIALVLVFFIGGGGSDSRFVGTWAYEEPTYGMNVIYKFNSDGSLEAGMDMETMKVGNWRVSGNNLCFEITVASFLEIDMGEQCGPFSFSSDGSQLTLTSGGQSITFTKQ